MEKEQAIASIDRLFKSDDGAYERFLVFEWILYHSVRLFHNRKAAICMFWLSIVPQGFVRVGQRNLAKEIGRREDSGHGTLRECTKVDG